MENEIKINSLSSKQLANLIFPAFAVVSDEQSIHYGQTDSVCSWVPTNIIPLISSYLELCIMITDLALPRQPAHDIPFHKIVILRRNLNSHFLDSSVKFDKLRRNDGLLCLIVVKIYR